MALRLAQSRIDRSVDLLVDRLAQIADQPVQVAERGKLDALLDQCLDRRADQVRRVAHDLGGTMDRPDHDFAATVGERTAAKVLANRFAVPVHRRRPSGTTDQRRLFIESEHFGDMLTDLIRNVFERREIAQELPRLQADGQRQPTNLAVGVSADESFLSVTQGEVGL